jgi:uncharacterized membrane protein (UPF0136 family)
MVVVVVFIVYGLLLFVDAGVEYRRTRGTPGLIAGLCSGTIAIAAGVTLLLGFPIGASIGIGLLLAMMAVFASRYLKTRAFMPSGLMFMISLIAAGAIASRLG